MLQAKIRQAIFQSLRRVYHDIELPHIVITPSEREEFGDYSSNIAMMLATLLKKNPLELGNILSVDLQKKEFEWIKKIDIVGPGFINIWVHDHVIMQYGNDIMDHPDTWVTSTEGKGKTVILDYFQLNIAKEPHVGHLRSAVIGDALKRILLARGYTTVADTHVGDWGTQFGILLYAYKKAVLNHKVLQEDIKKDPFAGLQTLYVEANKEEDVQEKGKVEFAKLEHGDKENREIWQWMVDISMKKLEHSAIRLGLLGFEEHRGESVYEHAMTPIVKMALQKGVAKKIEDGAVIVDLDDEGLDHAILIKSDGASTYLLRDLATIQHRKKAWHFWKNIYVVDNRQSHHFRQLFRVAELLGFEGVSESEHVEFGFMKLPEGAMSTRAGNAISLDVVLDEAEARAREVIRAKNPDLANADSVAMQVGLGAIKFFDLSHNRRSDVVFRWEEALAFEGNSGPYIQYTHARLKSILQKSNHKAISNKFSEIVKMDSVERNLLLRCVRLPEVMERVIETWSPHLLATYLFELAQQANEFYHSHPVISETHQEKKEFLIMLVQVTATTLGAGLYLLGIDAPEKM